MKRFTNILSVILFVFTTAAVAHSQGIPLPAANIPQFVDALPLLSAAGGSIETIVAVGGNEITLNMLEFQANMMPSTFVPATGTYTGTWVFGYRQGPTTAPANAVNTYTGPVIVTTRNVPTQIRYVNNLTANHIFWREWTDLSLHSAFNYVQSDPASNMGMEGNALNYMGPVPAVPHLHGAEDPAIIDGGPEAWFLSNVGDFSLVKNAFGRAYYTGPDIDGGGVPAAANEAIYRYPNSQEASPLWFHDHLLGGTRLNATFAGLAGAYLNTDPNLVLPPGLNPIGLENPGTPPTNVRLSVPLVLQDRMFDTNGQLFFPNVGVNPGVHPKWIPEFVGDTIVVNGKVWPFMSVDQQRYRFVIINGSNSRPYEMFLEDEATGIMGPPMWVIATDGGYLDNAVLVDPNAIGSQKKAGVQSTLTMMPGERYTIIVDFNDPGWKARLPMKAAFPRNLVLRNVAATVNGKPNAKLDGRLVQFRVSANTPLDTSFNPAVGATGAMGAAIRTSGQTIKPLVNFATGALAQGVIADKTRELVLVEVMGPAGPLEVLVNNTGWNGLRADGITPVNGGMLVQDNYITEFPKEGETEVWEIVNTTADSHPIHLHGVQYQILNRQAFNLNTFRKAYDALFPGGVFVPNYGSPLPYSPTDTGYNQALQGGKYGGNPDVNPYLKGAATPPLTYEWGWKDTAIMHPGEVTRIAVRFAPYAYNDFNPYFPYNPSAEDGYYVWHCHITDHEDNDMMRPDQFVPNPAAAGNRTYLPMVDF
jgi:spore coat protein A